MNSVIAFLILIAILVFFHEFGHFIVAKLCGVGVETFSFGFGPKLLKKRWKETEYCISAIPLGGYVKMTGDEYDDNISQADRSKSFIYKKLYQKIMIVAAGPFFNFLLSIFIFYVIFLFSGTSYMKPVVGKVKDNSPAQKAGVQSGDIIKKIDGKDIASFEEMSAAIRASKGETIRVVVERSNNKTVFSITPEPIDSKNIFNEDVTVFVIGVEVTGERVPVDLNPATAMVHSLDQNWQIAKLTVISVGKMIKGDISFKDNLGGPIRIAKVAGEAAELGVVNFAFLVALISISLGMINLLPIPVLDGGHLMFFIITAVTGKEVSDSIKEKANQIGIAILVCLMIFVIYNDIVQSIKG